MSNYKIVLLHRRREGARVAFQTRWAAIHTPHLQSLRAALGFQSHARIDLVPAVDPLLNLVRASRSWLSVALTALTHGESVPAPERREEGWDVVEELWYASREAMVAAFAGPAGREAARQLVEARAGVVAETAAVIGPELMVIPPPDGATAMPLRCSFCLHPKAGMSAEEMHRYWREDHRRLVESLATQLGFLSYDQHHAEPGFDDVAAALGAQSAQPYEGIASLSYPSERSQLEHVAHGGLAANQKLTADELHFVDPQRLVACVGTRRPAPAVPSDPVEPITHHPTLFGLRRPLRLPPLSRHWLRAGDGTVLRLHHAQGGAQGENRGAVILAPGTAMTGLSYCLDTVRENLPEYLVRAGFDVWLFDWRTSPELPAHTLPYSLDDVGRNDWPAAVDYVCRATGADRVSILAHCLSSPALMLSLVRGHLDGARIDAIVASQVALHLQVDWLGKVKQWSHVDRILSAEDIIHLEPEHVTAAMADDVVTGLAPLLPETDPCGNAACVRQLVTFGGLVQHDRLNPETHACMGPLIPEVGTGFLKAVAPVTARVDLLTGEDLNHLDRLALPITLISGERNRMFVQQGTLRSHQLLCEANGPTLYRREVLANYGHLDCLLGSEAATDVYPLLADSLGPAVRSRRY